MLNAFTHLIGVGALFVLHGVWVQDPNDSARVSFPKFCVHVPKQEERNIHFQVMEVIQLPDAESLALIEMTCKQRKCHSGEEKKHNL